MTNRSGPSRRETAKQRAAAAVAAAYPPWILFEPYCTHEVVEGSSCSIADAKTLAAGRTSTGSPIGVALSLAAPPEPSRVCIQHMAGVMVSYSLVQAAHGDSVLIQVFFQGTCDEYEGRVDRFVYNAGDAAADPPRPPSLSLLPPYCPTDEGNLIVRCDVDSSATGLLRRGEDELVVADLDRVSLSYNDDSPKEIEFRLFRSGEWSTTSPRISHADGEEEELLSTWTPHAVVPVGDRLLCWVDSFRGVMFSDVFDERPTLRYVPYPVESLFGFDVCVTAGDVVRLVNVFPRCCCGGEGASECRRSLHAYTINTWTLRMDDMAWVMDGMVDATELWALDAYGGLPRIQPDYPVVSLDDSNTICFMVCESYHVKHGDKTEWLVMVDTRRKTIQSVFRYPEGRRFYRLRSLIPSRVSDYLNSYQSSSNGGTSSPGKTHIGTASPPTVVDDEPQINRVINNSAQSFCNSSVEPMQQVSKVVSLEKKILMALEEIPGLARDDMLKAYSILSYDNGRRFGSLLELPMNLKKDWLLLEIKASEACSVCSACTKDVQY